MSVPERWGDDPNDKWVTRFFYCVEMSLVLYLATLSLGCPSPAWGQTESVRVDSGVIADGVGEVTYAEIVGITFPHVDASGYRLLGPFWLVLLVRAPAHPEKSEVFGATLHFRAPPGLDQPEFPATKSGREERERFPYLSTSVACVSSPAEEGVWRLKVGTRGGWRARKLQIFAEAIRYALSEGAAISAELSLGAGGAGDIAMMVVPAVAE